MGIRRYKKKKIRRFVPLVNEGWPFLFSSYEGYELKKNQVCPGSAQDKDISNCALFFWYINVRKRNLKQITISFFNFKILYEKFI